MTDVGRTLEEENPYHVEAQGVEGGFFVEEVVFGEGADGSLFMWGDGLERVSEAGSPAQLHLDEYERGAFSHDEIDLPVAGAVVALNQGVAARGEVTQRQVLPPGAGGPLLQAPPAA